MCQRNVRIGIIGFGEVGYAFGKGFREAGVALVAAYNNGTRHRPPYGPEFRARAEGSGVSLVDSLPALAERADVIFSATSGKGAAQVAGEVALHLRPRHIYADVNNASPMAKQDGARAVEAHGARFVDVMIKGSPAREGVACMMFCSGPAAPEFHDLLAPYAPRIRVITGPVGTAALLKNVTEVLSKGGQALLWEALLALVKSGQPLGSVTFCV